MRQAICVDPDTVKASGNNSEDELEYAQKVSQDGHNENAVNISIDPAHGSVRYTVE